MEKTDKDKLRKNRVRLIKELYIVNDLLAFLEEKRILTEEMVERIKVHTEKEQHARSSELLSLLPKRGPKAFDIFIEALVETDQDHLAEILDPVLTASLLNNKPHMDRQEMEMVHSQDTKEPGEVQPTDKNMAAKRLQQDDVYDMSTNPRGRAVIINNEIFKGGNRRHGTNVDENKLIQLFKNLYFEVILHRDLTAEQIRTTLDQERLSQEKSANAFVLCILSHGEKNCITGTDRMQISIDEITAMFDGNSCPRLLKKPKIFFFQACQGSTQATGVAVDETDLVMTDEMEKLSVVDSPDAKLFSIEETVHPKKDTLVAYATVPGFISIRHVFEGSWFINDLVDTFSEHACNYDILHLLTKVGNKVSARQTSQGTLQVIETVHSLTKDLYFFPGYAVKR